MRCMNNLRSTALIGAALLVAVLATVRPAPAEAPVGMAITYQGELRQGGSPVDDTCAFEFSLWNDPASVDLADQVGPTLIQTVDVAEGRFAATLDFGGDVFTGGRALWLEIAVCCPVPCGPPTTLMPRQELTPAPHALALPGLYTQQNVTSPNLLGGYVGNSVELGVVGATISGGGAAAQENRVFDDFATVSGGRRNTASGAGSTIDGGNFNNASGFSAAVQGGWFNTAAGDYSSAAGRKAKANNRGAFVWADSDGGSVFGADFASTAADQFLIRAAGGVGIGTSSPTEQLDVAGNFHSSGTITSGSSITIDGATDTITSNGDLELHVNDGRALRLETNVISPNLIGGYSGNSVEPSAVGATIAGGGDSFEQNRVFDDWGTVGGGRNNEGGSDDANPLTAQLATVCGGRHNIASGSRSTIAGGENNIASGTSSFVGGGGGNTASGSGVTIGGGLGNTASGFDSTVGGGFVNSASGGSSTVAGGASNTASGERSTVGGGFDNTAGGVSHSTVAGGFGNAAIGFLSTVGGGALNAATGSHATVPGGRLNSAVGDYSFGAGRRAKANHAGAFVWGDSTDADFPSAREANFTPAVNQFLARTTGGAVFVSAIDGTGNSTAGVELAAGGGSWSSLSDRNAKTNVDRVDGREILERLRDVPIATGNYKAQDEAIRHIGPMAQDFSEAFGVGEKETMITTIDADGVALAAIQGLYDMVKEKDVEIAELRSEMKDRIAALEKKLVEFTAQTER